MLVRYVLLYSLQMRIENSYQMHLKSPSGPILVLLVNQGQSQSSPLVVEVSHLLLVVD